MISILLARILPYSPSAAIMALQVVALAVTVFRVWVRLHIRRFWYDDGFAAAAGLCCVVKVISSWTLVDSKSSAYLFVGRIVLMRVNMIYRKVIGPFFLDNNDTFPLRLMVRF